MSKSINGEYTQKVKITPVDGVYWKGQPAGLWDRFKSLIHMNFTEYRITEDELIVSKGFFKRTMDTHELYVLKDVDLTQGLIQRMLGVADISAIVDAKGNSQRLGNKVILKNVRDSEKVRKLLRDAIEDDVMERGIKYYDNI